MHVSLRETGSLTKRLTTAALLLSGATFCAPNPTALAQDTYSIRVESNEVLVPVQVYDTRLLGVMRYGSEIPCTVTDERKLLDLRLDEVYTPTDCHEFGEVRGLSARDFHLFEDGIEQKIQKATLVLGSIVLVRDNYPRHIEYSGTPAGRWIWPDALFPARPPAPVVTVSTVSGTLPAGQYSVRIAYLDCALFVCGSGPTIVTLPTAGRLTVNSPPALSGTGTYYVYIGTAKGSEKMQGHSKIGTSFVQSSTLRSGEAEASENWETSSPYFYLIGYVPSKSSEGKCHKITVKVDRHDSFVYYRDQYCYVSHSASDPLKGTKFGEQMEGYGNSEKSGKIPFHVQTGIFYKDADNARLNLALEFPWQSLSVDRSNGYLYATIGMLGLVYRKNGPLLARFSDCAYCSAFHRPESYISGEGPPRQLLDEVDIPTGYQTEMDLTPGEYEMRLVLSDGTKFGLIRVPLTVDQFDGNHLDVSSVVLCKRFRHAQVAEEEARAANLSPKYVPLVSKGVQLMPTGDTTFRKGEPLFAYFEVYEPLLTGTPAATVQTQLRITDVKTGQLKVDTGWRSAADWIEPGKSAIHIAEQIAVDKLPAGSYRLDVQATDSAGKSTVWRAANFTVE
jgi:hypothetical protein